jgi:hypothetical protein
MGSAMEVRMNKIILAMILCTLSLNVFACGGKDGEEDKRFETQTSLPK